MPDAEPVDAGGGLRFARAARAVRALSDDRAMRASKADEGAMQRLLHAGAG